MTRTMTKKMMTYSGLILLFCLLFLTSRTASEETSKANDQQRDEIINGQPSNLGIMMKKTKSSTPVDDVIVQEAIANQNSKEIPNSKDLLVQSVNNEKPKVSQSQRDVVSQLREKMEANMRLAIDTVNQLIGSTNQTLLSQYNERQRRLYEWYERAQNEMKTELANAHGLLDRLIVDSGAIIGNMQTHFDRLMSSTVERTYVDMIAMLSSAIGNIQTVCIEIMEKLKSGSAAAVDSAASKSSGHAAGLTNVIERGLGLINQVGDKLKSDMEGGVALVQQKLASVDNSAEGGHQERLSNEMTMMKSEKMAMDEASHKTIELAKKLLNQKRHQLEMGRRNGDLLPVKMRSHSTHNKEHHHKKKLTDEYEN